MGKYGRADKGPLKSIEMLKCFAALSAVINVIETDWVIVMVELAENDVCEGREMSWAF